MVEGHELWAAFLAARGLTDIEAADAIGVTRGLLSQWKNGSRPGAEVRDRIERWTRGEVPAASWRTAEEQARLDEIVPVRRLRRGAAGAAA
jgi:transcriptional regulator with XRE-family HTH domain